MAELRWALTCERVIIDRQTNAASYIDAVEELVVPQVPFPVPPFIVGTLWERRVAGEVVEVRVRFLDPSAEILTEIPTRLEDPVAIRHRANFAVFVATRQAGRHDVVIEQKLDRGWREAARLPINVSVQPSLEFATVPLPQAAPPNAPEELPRKKKHGKRHGG